MEGLTDRLGGKEEIPIGFWCGNLKKKEKEDDVDGRRILKWILNKYDPG
jgi:hypothetical protein